MRFARKSAAATPEPSPVASEPAPLMRFLTLGGAVVTVTGSGGEYYARCLGCGWRDFRNPIDTPERARGYANGHAGGCRSMPRPEVSA